MHIDNIRDILLLGKTSLSQQMNHIDVHHHLIYDYVEYETVEIQFVRYEETLMDPCTNTLSDEPFESLTFRHIHRE